MAPTCSPPKSVKVRAYDRGSGATKRRRRAKAKAVQAAKPIDYYECEDTKGNLCGTHHRTFSGAVAHRKRLDKAARAYRARHNTPLNDWIVLHPSQVAKVKAKRAAAGRRKAA